MILHVKNRGCMEVREVCGLGPVVGDKDGIEQWWQWQGHWEVFEAQRDVANSLKQLELEAVEKASLRLSVEALQWLLSVLSNPAV
ncbi:hypothetical protein ARMSODRAFT_1017311 [Armillaria solidipes]|uniref:Uncharacterized protein n=1 Tax=Armillaria solidipes TaxID=1076256 RepID=A0A2H3BKI8_9AGAR|nr:hypothetical protein ARMSODRAFT_1017311 [Armillaria solidipes]